MPTLHRFDNCVIRMYANDHLPPHFHIGMNDGRECLVEIGSLEMLAGRINRREIAEPLAWAKENIAALRTTWKELNP
jgi:hypothetical protein